MTETITGGSWIINEQGERVPAVPEPDCAMPEPPDALHEHALPDRQAGGGQTAKKPNRTQTES